MKVLIIGAAGMFGGRVARELVGRGHAVRALQRAHGRVVAIAGAEVTEGDALDPASLRRAAEGCDAIVFGFHLPYDQWERGAVRAAEVTADVAADAGLTVLFPGNVYGLGPDFTAPLTEDVPKSAPTRMGSIRNAMEATLRARCSRGARVIVLRAGDYIGPATTNSWLTLMTARAVRGGALLAPAPDDVLHAWAFLPDVVRASVDLLERRATLAAYEELNFEGYTLTQAQMLDAVRLALGDPSRRARSVPWWLLRLLAPLWPKLRSVVEMSYLWRLPVRLDGGKLRRLLPDLQVTALPEAVSATLGRG